MQFPPYPALLFTDRAIFLLLQSFFCLSCSSCSSLSICPCFVRLCVKERKLGYEPTSHIPAKHTHTYTNINWNRDCCTRTGHSERAKIYQRRGPSTSLWLHTNTHQYLHAGRCTTLRAQQKDNMSTITRSRLHAALSIEQVGEMTVETRGKTEREAEVRRRDGAKGSRWRRARRSRLSYCNGSQTGAASWVQLHFFWREVKSSHLSPKNTHWSFFKTSFC